MFTRSPQYRRAMRLLSVDPESPLGRLYPPPPLTVNDGPRPTTHDHSLPARLLVVMRRGLTQRWPIEEGPQ
jgi:hypothetical protein